MFVSHAITTLLAGYLIWTRQHRLTHALPAPEESTTTIIHFDTSTLLSSGEHCVEDSDCANADLFCEVESLRCQCKEINNIISPDNNCLPLRRLGEECHIGMQCRAANGQGMADCIQSLCACKHGFVSSQENNGTVCIAAKSGPDTTIKTKKMYFDINMIIIIVVLAVMFIGICVALHLFSRARFRNHRTIFNDPHPRLMHIKLGKKQKRRRSNSSLHVPASRHPSICSQLSVAGARSRAGSKAASPESVRSLKTEIDGKLGAPIAKLEESSPTSEEAKKDPNWRNANGPDVVKEASVVQNGPSSPTIIVTNINGSRSSSEAHSPASATRV